MGHSRRKLQWSWIFPGFSLGQRGGSAGQTARKLSPQERGSLQPWGCQGQWGGRGCAEQHHRHLSFSDLGSSEGPLSEAQPRECCTELLFLHLQFTPFQPSLRCLNVKTPASPSALLRPGRFRGEDVSWAQVLGQALTPEGLLWKSPAQKTWLFLAALGWYLCACAVPDPAEIYLPAWKQQVLQSWA